MACVLRRQTRREMIAALFHRRRHFAIVAWLVFAVSLLKGLRMPSSWSATHMTFNYSQGFIRRGLVGEVIRLTEDKTSYSARRWSSTCPT